MSVIRFGVAEPHERPIQCGARRGARSSVACELPALHMYSHDKPIHEWAHLGRSPAGRWFLWGTPPHQRCTEWVQVNNGYMLPAANPEGH